MAGHDDQRPGGDHAATSSRTSPFAARHATRSRRPREAREWRRFQGGSRRQTRRRHCDGRFAPRAIELFPTDGAPHVLYIKRASCAPCSASSIRRSMFAPNHAAARPIVSRKHAASRYLRQVQAQWRRSYRGSAQTGFNTVSTVIANDRVSQLEAMSSRCRQDGFSRQ